MANFADDNTPYTIEETNDTLLLSICKEASILTKWFKDNFFRMNADKCHLLVCNYDRCFINFRE